MAIWQYKIYALPAEEYNTFFAGKQQINEDAFDEIKWWKYRKPKKIGERFPYLPLTKSWSSDITLFGSHNSDCVKLLQEDDYYEISIQFDLRELNGKFIEDVLAWVAEENFIILEYTYKFILPTKEHLLKSIADSHEVKWLNKLSSGDNS